MRLLRASALVVLALVGGAQPAGADWLVTPFAGAMIRTTTGFLDLDDAARRRHGTYGVALTRFPDNVFGVEVETSATPSLFTGHDLVESSRVLTLTGSMVLALPQRWSRVVRPYATIGAGVIHVSSTDIAGIFPIDSTRPAASVGAGLWLPITPRFGARAGMRYLRARADSASTQFETWQVTAGATFRF